MKDTLDIILTGGAPVLQLSREGMNLYLQAGNRHKKPTTTEEIMNFLGGKSVAIPGDGNSLEVAKVFNVKDFPLEDVVITSDVFLFLARTPKTPTEVAINDLKQKVTLPGAVVNALRKKYPNWSVVTGSSKDGFGETVRLTRYPEDDDLSKVQQVSVTYLVSSDPDTYPACIENIVKAVSDEMTQMIIQKTPILLEAVQPPKEERPKKKAKDEKNRLARSGFMKTPRTKTILHKGSEVTVEVYVNLVQLTYAYVEPITQEILSYGIIHLLELPSNPFEGPFEFFTRVEGEMLHHG